MKIIKTYFFLFFLISIAYAEPPLEETKNLNIEYATPQLAIEALKTKPGVELTTESRGWIIASDRSANVIWSFPPANDPSYPAMVKRTIVESPTGSMSVKMDIKCGASKEACDNLVRQFLELNEKAKQEIQNKHANAK